MKHKIFKTLLAVVAVTMTFCAEAETETVNGIDWNYSVENGKAGLGSGYSTPAIPKSTSGAITIPSTLGGYPVTSIGDSAFDGCSSLTSVTIPNSVTSIGEFAFNDCSSLKSVTIPNSVTSIVQGSFGGCSSLKSVTIPNSVTSIGDLAFSGCTYLRSVTIPDSVTSIGKYAFSACTNLRSVTIPDSVQSIGNDAFSGCESLSLTSYTDGFTFYTNIGNASRLRKILSHTGANVKEIIEQGTKEIIEQGIDEQKANRQENGDQGRDEQRSRASYGWYYGFAVLILVGLLFWIVRRKKKREGASDKTSH